MDVTAESVIELCERRDRVRGLRFTYEPQLLRFFQARFAPVVGRSVLEPMHVETRRPGYGEP
jgi:hypothetical protein